jgi:hypothetical protein
MRLAGAELGRRRSCRCRVVTTKQRVSRPDSMSLSARAMSLSTITKRGQEPEWLFRAFGEAGVHGLFDSVAMGNSWAAKG